MSGKITKFKDMLVDTPNRYTVNGEVKTIVFSPNAITQEGTKDKAEYFNEIQKNGLYNVNATRVVEGTVEFYDTSIEGSDIFDVFDTQFIINFNETNTKLNPVLRFNGNNYYIRMIESFIDVDVAIGTLQKTYIGFLDSTNNKLKLFRNERKLTFDTISDAQASTWLVEGDIIEVLGYYLKGDGAKHERIYSLTDDESGKAVTSGGFLNYLYSGKDINIKHFGAVGDGITDDTVFIQNAINYANLIQNGNYIRVTIPRSDGEFIFTSIRNKPYVNLNGRGGILKLKDNTCIKAGTSYYLIHNLGTDNSKYVNLKINGNQANNTLYTVADSITCVGKNSEVYNCEIINSVDSGIMLSTSKYGSAYNNYIENCRDLGIYINALESNQEGDMQCYRNKIENCVYGGIGIKRGSERIDVSFNEINNCGNAITVEDFGVGLGGAPDWVSILYNFGKNIGFPYRTSTPAPAEVGIQLGLSTKTKVIGNSFENVSGIGINVSGVIDSIIAENIMTGYSISPVSTGNRGIFTSIRSGVYPENLKITNNQFIDFNNQAGFFQSLKNSTVKDNTFYSVASTGLRVNADTFNNDIVDNLCKGVTDLEYYSGMQNSKVQNKAMNSTSIWVRNGYRENISLTTPIGNVTPISIGEIYRLTSGTDTFWLSVGFTNTDWVQIR